MAASRPRPGADRRPVTVVANAAVNEPGAFGDRALLRANPYVVVEGLLIAAAALQSDTVYIGINETFTVERERLESAIDQMTATGMGDDRRVVVVDVADDYTNAEPGNLVALIDDRVAGALGAADRPVVVHTSETFAHVAHIVARGAGWFRSIGPAESPGTRLVTVVGDVRRPGVAEVPSGIPVRDAIDHVADGTRSGRRPKAVLVGLLGSVLTGDDLGLPLAEDPFLAAGAELGADGLIVVDAGSCMVEVAFMAARALEAAGCGRCPGCVTGFPTVAGHLGALCAGQPLDVGLAGLFESLRLLTTTSRCPVPAQIEALVTSLVQAFPSEFAEHLDGHLCPGDPSTARVVTPIVDLLRDGAVHAFDLDARHHPAGGSSGCRTCR